MSLVVAIVVVLGAAGAYFDIIQPMVQGDAPAAAVRQFCADEMHQDYAAAYGLLAPGDVSTLYGINQAQFVQILQQRDHQYGPVRACAITRRAYLAMLFNTGAAFQVAVKLNDGTHTGIIGLTKQGTWKITSLDHLLHLDG